MDDVLRPVDLDRRPVSLHCGDLAAGDAPQETGAGQVIQRAHGMRGEQGPRIPAQVGRAFGPGLPLIKKSCAVIEEKLPSVSGDA